MINSLSSSVFGIFIYYDDHLMWREYLTCNSRILRSWRKKTKYHKPFYHSNSKCSWFGPYHLSPSGPNQTLGASIPLGGHGGNFVWMGARKLIPIIRGGTW